MMYSLMAEAVSIDKRKGWAGQAGQRTVVFDDSQQTQRAFGDLVEGLRAWQLWGSLGWNDIRQRYARTVLGPLWLTLSMAILVVGLGFVYGGLFGMQLHTYLPFVGVGFIIWGLISTFVIDGCVSFNDDAHTIKQIAAPLSVYAYRVVWRTLLVFLHNIIIYIGISI